MSKAQRAACKNLAPKKFSKSEQELRDFLATLPQEDRETLREVLEWTAPFAGLKINI